MPHHPLPALPFHHVPHQEMEDEKSFKDKQLKTSEATMRRLNQDKEKRLQEMEKVKTLDEKVWCDVCCHEKELELKYTDVTKQEEEREI